MSSVIVFNGISYTIPDTNDVSWGASVTAYLKAIPGGVLAKTGGAWELTAADLDLGTAFGVAAPYFKSNAASISASGVLRMALTDLVTWRKDGSSDYRLGVGANGFATWETIDLVDVSSAQILSNKLIDANLNTILNLTSLNLSPMAGITYSQLQINPGEIPYSVLALSGQITNADISPTANIDGSKVNTDFGPSQVITSGGLRLGTTNHVTLNADPSEDYDFIFPDTDGVDGQALVRQSGELVWASIPGLSLPQNNLTIGDAGSLPQATDTASLGDILADSITGLTIKDDTITDLMINSSAAIDVTKLAALTASSYVVTDASGYLDTVTINPLDKAGDTMTGLLGLDAEGILFDTVSATPADPSIGQTFWDDMDNTIATKISADVTLQHGQENHLFVRNDSGALITNGSVVYVNSANTARATIRLAQANSSTSDRTIGIVTADIADTAFGYVTTFGLVRNLTTNVDGDGAAVTDGTPVYLSATTAGEWVTTEPTAPNHNICLGQVINAAAGTAGTLFVSVKSSGHLTQLHDVGISAVANRDTLEYDSTLTYWKNVPSVKQYTKEETGFVDPAGLTVTYNGDRTITITHATAIIYLYQGIRFNLGASWTSVAHSATLDAAYFLAFDAAGVGTWYASFPGFDNGVYVAYVNYGTSNKYAIRECHGLMNWQAWEEFHRTIGTYRVSGGLVPAASWVANTYTTVAVTPAVDAAVIQDEDLPTDIPAFADGSTYTRIHFDTGNVVFSTTSTLPFPNDGTNIQYNQNPTTGTALTAISTNGRYLNVYGIFVPATADATSQAYRILWMTGQQIYTTLAAAQGEDFRTLTTGNLATIFPEFVPFIRVTYNRQTAGGSTTTFNAMIPAGGVSYIVGTRAGLTSLTGFTPTDHNTLTGRSDADSHPASAITGTAVTIAGIETLTNKTLTAPVITDFESYTEIATPANPSAGSLKVYAKTDDKLYTLNSAGVEVPVGSGSGSSSEINYISNPLFEETANAGVPAGWVTYADAAQATPVDGTGGSPTVTFTASTSSPIRGLVSAVFTKDAANRQGEGVAYAFTIPAVDKGKLVGINFDITPAGSYASSDMSVYVYDVTNSVLITPAAVSIPNNIGTFTTSFGLTAGTSYRLILHVASTNASAYTLKVDNVSTGYKPTPQGAVVEEWKSYTPTFGGFGTTANVSFIYRRVGTAVEIVGKFNAGTPTSALATVSLPFGTIGGETGQRMYAGDIVRNATNGPYRVAAVQGRSYMTFGGGTIQVTADYNGDSFVGAGELLYLHVSIPIAEWAGSGVVNLAQNDVEYAFNNSATTDTDTNSFGYGSSGFAMQAFAPAGTASVQKTVRFQSTIQTGDKIVLEWSSTAGGQFISFAERGLTYSQNDAGSTSYGAFIIPSSSNEVIVYFFSAPFVGVAWASLAGYWRVRKTSAGAAVGWGAYVPGVSSGLVPSAGLPGRTDGQAVASGYCGEVAVPGTTVRAGTGGYTYSVRSTVVPLTSLTDLIQFTAKKGIYLFCVNGDVYQASGSTRDFDGGLQIGGVTVSILPIHSCPTGFRQRINFVTPITVTTDDTVVSFIGRLSSVNADAAQWELTVTRMA